MALTITPEITGQVVTEAKSYKYLFEPLRVKFKESLSADYFVIDIETRYIVDNSLVQDYSLYVLGDLDQNNEALLDLMQVGRDFLGEELYKISQYDDITYKTIVPDFYIRFKIITAEGQAIKSNETVNIVPILGGRSFNQFQPGLDYTQPLTEWEYIGIEKPVFKNYPNFSQSLIELREGTAATTEHPRWNDSGDPNIYGRDTFGFGALPGGIRKGYDGLYVEIVIYSYLWSLTEYDSGKSYYKGINYSSSALSATDFGDKDNGLSVRLVRAYDPADGDKIDGRVLSDTFSDYDGNTYDGVIIGDQVWSTTNLKTTSYADGTAIPTGYNDTDWSNLTTGAYAVYDHNLVTGIDSEVEMIAAYGLLYNWYAVDDSRGLSSDGSVPTDAQFTQLTDYIIANYPDIDSTNIGDHLKSTRQVNSPLDSDDIRPEITITTPSEGRNVCGAYIIWKSRFGGWMSYGFDIFSEDSNIDYEGDIDMGLFEATDSGNPYVPTNYTRISESYSVNLRALGVKKQEAQALKGLSAAAVCYLMRTPDSKMELMRISSVNVPLSKLTDGVDVSVSLSSISKSTQNIR